MTPFIITFLPDSKENESFTFESNEKPFKGELYSIIDSAGKTSEAKITEVSKVVIRKGQHEATLVYQCKIEKHEANPAVIGFGKRN